MAKRQKHQPSGKTGQVTKSPAKTMAKQPKYSKTTANRPNHGQKAELWPNSQNMAKQLKYSQITELRPKQLSKIRPYSQNKLSQIRACCQNKRPEYGQNKAKINGWNMAKINGQNRTILLNYSQMAWRGSIDKEQWPKWWLSSQMTS